MIHRDPSELLAYEQDQDGDFRTWEIPRVEPTGLRGSVGTVTVMQVEALISTWHNRTHRSADDFSVAKSAVHVARPNPDVLPMALSFSCAHVLRSCPIDGDNDRIASGQKVPKALHPMPTSSFVPSSSDSMSKAVS